jgi:hypothetical protein
VASASSGGPAAGSSRPAPVAKATAAAVWPEGNEREIGIRTWRPSGTAAPARSGLDRRASGLITAFTTAAVTATEARPEAAARRPLGPPAARQAAAARESRE